MNIELHNTNKKLGKRTIVLNMTTAIDCPSKRLGLCAIHKICYAKQAELRFKKRVFSYRKHQAKAWKSLNAKEITKQIFLNALHRYSKIKWLRVSECGDFNTQEDVNKLSEIAHRLVKYGILVYTYTKRKDLDFTNLSNNLIVNGSEFMLDNEFRIVNEYSGNYETCRGDCNVCSLCKEKGKLIIENKFHGVSFNYLKRRKNGNKDSENRH
jgi:hypothetical protein